MDTGEEDDADKRKVEFKAQTSPCKIEALKPRDDRVPTREVEAVTVAKVTEQGGCGNGDAGNMEASQATIEAFGRRWDEP